MAANSSSCGADLYHDELRSSRMIRATFMKLGRAPATKTILVRLVMRWCLGLWLYGFFKTAWIPDIRNADSGMTGVCGFRDDGVEGIPVGQR